MNATAAGSSLLLESAQVASFAIGEMVLIAACGALAARLGYLDNETMRPLARAMMRLLFPCVMLSASRSYTADRLSRWWVVVIVGWVHIAMGAAVGLVGATLLRVRAPRRQMLVLSCAFGNVGALPFVLSGPIVANYGRASAGFASTHVAADAAHGIVALYTSAWVLAFFTVGQRYAATMAPPAPPPAGLERARRRRGLRRCLDADPVVVAVLLAILIGCEPSLKHAVHLGGLRFAGGALEALGDAGIVISTMMLGASLQIAAAGRGWLCRGRAEAKPAARVSEATRPPAVTSPSCGCFLPRAEAVGGVVGGAVGGAVGGSMAGPAAAAAGVPGSAAGRRRLPLGATLSEEQVLVTAAAALKLVAVPAVCVPLTALATSAGALPDEPLLLVLLHVMSSVPSSQTAISLLLAIGQPRLAGQLSEVYVPMYLFSVFTMGAVIVIAVEIIGPGP